MALIGTHAALSQGVTYGAPVVARRRESGRHSQEWNAVLADTREEHDEASARVGWDRQRRPPSQRSGLGLPPGREPPVL